MKKRVHLIANAHLDPVWLWRWEEGCTEALSTFLTASELLDEFPEFKFNHNESILYEWVKEYNPMLFKKLQEQVKQGSWEITGGWYLQPDCNMPSGESMIRNIMLGRMFFLEHFGKYPKTAINYDSFGHSRGLVQILAKAGFEHYLVYRPGHLDFKDADFIWKGLDGSEVIVHRSDEGYNSIWGEAVKKLTEFLEQRKNEEVSLCLWGVGDHGGGPTRKDLEDIRNTKLHDAYEIVHSTPDAYFSEIKLRKQELKTVTHGLNPVAEGCYTSQIRVKQKHRLLENELYSAEKMASAAALLYGRPYPKENFDEAVRALIFAEFHDALPGSGSALVEEDTLRILEHGLELMSREKLYAALALSAGEERVKPDSSVIMFYNPHPYDITGVFECETGLPKQNWTPDFMYPVVEFNGKKIPAQAEKEQSNFQIDWRRKVVIQASLKAFSMNRMDISFIPIEKRPEHNSITHKPYYDFITKDMEVRINTQTGLVDHYIVKGVKYLEKGSFRLQMKDDTNNPWGFGSRNLACIRNFQLLLPGEASEFCGFSDQIVPSVRVIEDGEVRTVVEVLFGIGSSKAYIRYKLPKQGTGFEVEVLVHFAQKEQSLKLILETVAKEKASFEGQIMYGREKLRADGGEAVAQKWVMVIEEESRASIAVVNTGTYGVSFSEGELGLTLLRSPGYTAADSEAVKALHEKQYAPRMEQGIRVFSFYIEAGDEDAIKERIDNTALRWNEKPYGMSYCPPGTGEKKEGFMTLDNPAIVLSAVKCSENGECYVVRLYESTGKKQQVKVHIPICNILEEIIFSPFEIKTFLIKEGRLEETTIIEGI